MTRGGSLLALYHDDNRAMPEYIAPRQPNQPVSNGHSLGNGASSASSSSTAARPALSTGKTVLIDNYDSFTYNVVEVSQRPLSASRLSHHQKRLYAVPFRDGRRFDRISQR